jgi:hypothetical protein
MKRMANNLSEPDAESVLFIGTQFSILYTSMSLYYMLSLSAAVRRATRSTRRTRWSKCARGSHSLTHRRAAALSSRSLKIGATLPLLLRLILGQCPIDPAGTRQFCPSSIQSNRRTGCTGLTHTHLAVYVTRVNVYSGTRLRQHRPRVYAICRPELG